MGSIITLIVFIFILGLLIFVHELGHFLMAKRAGIKVEEFAFGFPPRIFAIKKGETEYALNLLPIGGYVKMLGEEEDPTATEKKNPKSFAHKSVWIRAKVVIAGVIMNFILGWLLISFGFMLGMPPIVSEPKSIPYGQVEQAVVIAAIVKGSAAEAMGLRPGDKVIKFNGQTVDDPHQLAGLTKDHKGQPVNLTIKRSGKVETISGHLGNTESPLGTRLSADATVRLPIWWAPIFGLWETLKAIGFVFIGVLGFFKQLIGSFRIPDEAAGPVQIYYITGSILKLGFTSLLSFMAILSINLGVINILPIPALDGGRLLFILLEKFNRGRKVVNQNIENIAHTVGFVLLILLILTITYNDILHIGK